MAKRCYICKNVLFAADIKLLILYPMECGYVMTVRRVRSMKYFTWNDLLHLNSMKKQGNHCWHRDCFKCIVSVYILYSCTCNMHTHNLRNNYLIYQLSTFCKPPEYLGISIIYFMIMHAQAYSSNHLRLVDTTRQKSLSLVCYL